MKSYALITTHAAINQGAALQTIATQRAFQKEGINIKIIDYVPDFIREGNKIIRKDKGIKIYIVDTLNRRARKRRYNKFIDFRKTYFNLSKKVFCEKDIREEVLDYDGIIIGSDQVWNPCIMGGELNRVYFADFAPKNIKIISYASSMGDEISFNENYAQQFLLKLKKFSAISVREQSGAEWIRDNLDIEATRVLDPTLLLTKEDWNFAMEGVKKIAKKPYIFIYSVGRTKDLIKYAKKAQKVLGYKIIVVGSLFRYPFRKTKYILDDCPSNFLQLIKNASLVITSSFHATAFSVNFNVPLLSFPSANKKVTRASELLKLVGLEKQFIDYDSDFNMSMLGIDWDRANKKLSELRKESIDYIRNATK